MAKAAPVSKFAPATLPEIPSIDGVRFSAGMAGVRYKRRVDVMLALLDEGTQVAGVFTRSKCPSAPVDWCRARLASGKARALLVNSGNANAFTGKLGREATKLSAELVAKAVGARASDLSRLDRRDRRAARRHEFQQVLPKLVAARPGRLA